MQQELRLHRIVVGSILIALLTFFLLVLRVRPSLSDERLEFVGALILVVFASASLVITSSIEAAVALEFGRRHKVEFATYLTLSILSMIGGLYLGISSKTSLQLLTVLISPPPILLGVMQLRMSRELGHHLRFRWLLRINGMVGIGCGVALIVGSRLSNRGTADVIACVGVLSVLQALPILLYPRRTWRKFQAI